MSEQWPTTRLEELLHRSEETVEVQADKEYREITVRLWGKGVVERGRVLGASVAGRRFVARDGQFIVSRIDARNGATGLVPKSLAGALVTNDFPLFDINVKRLEPGFLAWLSRTAGFVELCQRASEGTTNRVRLKEECFRTMEISLPRLDEQRRIVARIEELSAKIQEARSVRNQAAEEAKAIMVSATTRIFEGLLHGERQPLTALGVNNENPIQIGPFGAQLHKSEFTEEGVPVLNVGNVWPDGLVLDYLDHVSKEKSRQLARYLIKSGDLLFARSGATLGKVCLVPSKCDGWLMTGHLFRVRFDPVKIFNRFAFAAFRGSLQIQNQVFGQVRGATRPGYNTTLLGNVELPVPPLTEQRRIVAELDTLQAQVDALKKLQADTAAELDALVPSILDRAFKGKL